VTDAIRIQHASLQLSASIVPWDSAVFGRPVVAIDQIDVVDESAAQREFEEFERWLERGGVHLVSCRLSHAKLRESMFLETRGFRFVETVMHPRLTNFRAADFTESEASVAIAVADDLPGLCAIAEHAFHHERYYVDPRVERFVTGQRYRRWVESALEHPRQRLVAGRWRDQLTALFIIEDVEPASTYWHLVAVAPEWQGRGHGRKVFEAMLRWHAARCVSTVTTTTSARNVAMQNLCASLGFRMLPPEMTLHLVNIP